MFPVYSDGRRKRQSGIICSLAHIIHPVRMLAFHKEAKKNRARKRLEIKKMHKLETRRREKIAGHQVSGEVGVQNHDNLVNNGMSDLSCIHRLVKSG